MLWSEPEETTEATSKPKEPLDAVDIHYKVQEALRPLRIMADAEILLQGRYRNGENDAESDRAEDLARFAKQAYEGLRAFEDAGGDPSYQKPGTFCGGARRSAWQSMSWPYE